MTTTPERQRVARDELRRAFAARTNSFVVHYARDSFSSPIGRVAAIAVRNLGTGQTRLFSLVAVAPPNTSFTGASPQQLDVFERLMLDAYFSFVSRHQNHYWLHWNMRDAKFGFEAVEARHRALGGTPSAIADHHKIDLASRMFDLYGDRYAPPPDRLEAIAKKNGINVTSFMEGSVQGAAVDAGNLVPVDSSTLNKVDALFVIAEKAHAGQLKTHGTWWDRHGGTTNGVTQWVATHPLLTLTGFVAGIVGLVLTIVFEIW